MNTFYTHIQPNIIKFSDNEELPENLRCHYAINYNVWGIDYFFENYLLQESNDGIYMILNEDRFNFLLEDSLSDQNVLDIPRLYILITKEFLSDTSKFQEFILRASKDNEIYYSGIEGFRPGNDYFINTTLFNYLANINAVTTESENPTEYKLPNYIDENGSITKYFTDLSSEIIKDYTNLVYFDRKNELLNNTFSEDELNNFYQGISNIIIAYSDIQNNPSIYNKAKNQIYDKVLNYYSHSQVDDASIALGLILGSQYNSITTNQTCGCMGEIGNSNSLVTDSCASLYKNALGLYLKQMFGDPEFYEDWFYINLSEEEKFPNDVLIETLELFIKEFISIDYNLDFTYNHKAYYNCECTDNRSLNNSSLEYKKLNNFLQILDWVNNNQLDENANKIKIYGEAFGELLPKLQF